MWPDFHEHGQQACHYLLYSEWFGCVGTLAFSLSWAGAVMAPILAFLAGRLRRGSLRRMILALILAAPVIAITAWTYRAYPLPLPFMMRWGSLATLLAAPLLLWTVGSCVLFGLGRQWRAKRRR